MGLRLRKSKAPVDRGSHPARTVSSGPDMFDKADAEYKSPAAKAERAKGYQERMNRTPEQKWAAATPSERMQIHRDENPPKVVLNPGGSPTKGYYQRPDSENF